MSVFRSTDALYCPLPPPPQTTYLRFSGVGELSPSVTSFDSRTSTSPPIPLIPVTVIWLSVHLVAPIWTSSGGGTLSPSGRSSPTPDAIISLGLWGVLEFGTELASKSSRSIRSPPHWGGEDSSNPLHRLLMPSQAIKNPLTGGYREATGPPPLSLSDRRGRR